MTVKLNNDGATSDDSCENRVPSRDGTPSLSFFSSSNPLILLIAFWSPLTDGGGLGECTLTNFTR